MGVISVTWRDRMHLIALATFVPHALTPEVVRGKVNRRKRSGWNAEITEARCRIDRAAEEAANEDRNKNPAEIAGLARGANIILAGGPRGLKPGRRSEQWVV